MRSGPLNPGLAIVASVLLAGCTSGSPGAGPADAPTTHTAATSGPDAPRWFAVMRAGEVHWYDSRKGTPIGMSGGPTGTSITAIGSWHDGHSVVLAASPDRPGTCMSTVHRQIIERANVLDETELPHLRRFAGNVSALAVSPDHRRLALSVSVADKDGDGCERPELVVIALEEGTRTTWTLPYRETAEGDAPGGYGAYFVTNLAWAPDSRRLSLHYGQCCADSGGIWVLDTGRQGGRLIPKLRRVSSNASCPGAAFGWTDTGLISEDDQASCGGRTTHVVAIDPDTGSTSQISAAELPAPVAQISSDLTGTHFLAYAAQHVYRVDGDRLTELVALPWDPASPPDVVW